MTSAWEGSAEPYERSFGRLCAGTVDLVLEAVGDPGRSGAEESSRRLLDVGTGPGELAARAVSRGWTVRAADSEASMTRRAARRSGVRVVRAALPHLPFRAGCFAAVTANFVVNHVPDPRAAVAELARVAAPGGRVVATIWPSEISPMNQLWNRVMERADVLVQRPGQLPAELDFPRSTGGLAALLLGAGLVDVSVREVHWLFRIPADELWVAVEAGIAIVGQTYVRQDRASRLRMREAYQELSREYRVDGGEGRLDGDEDADLRLPSVAVLAVGFRGV